MRVTARVEVNFRNKWLKQLTADAVRDAMLELALDTQKQARINVAPGMGPGPHPHLTPHVDTGQLRESVQADVSEEGDRMWAEVFTKLDYGLYLETGWHSANGAFHRYPWLEPAARSTVPAWRERAARKIKMQVERGFLTTLKANIAAWMAARKIKMRVERAK